MRICGMPVSQDRGEEEKGGKEGRNVCMYRYRK